MKGKKLDPEAQTPLKPAGECPRGGDSIKPKHVAGAAFSPQTPMAALGMAALV